MNTRSSSRSFGARVTVSSKREKKRFPGEPAVTQAEARPRGTHVVSWAWPASGDRRTIISLDDCHSNDDIVIVLFECTTLTRSSRSRT